MDRIFKVEYSLLIIHERLLCKIQVILGKNMLINKESSQIGTYSM
ncbi:hypothetical protein [Methanolobus sp. WCC5]